MRILHSSGQWPPASPPCRRAGMGGMRIRERLAHPLVGCSGLRVPVSGCNRSVRCRRQPHGANTHQKLDEDPRHFPGVSSESHHCCLKGCLFQEFYGFGNSPRSGPVWRSLNITKMWKQLEQKVLVTRVIFKPTYHTKVIMGRWTEPLNVESMGVR